MEPLKLASLFFALQTFSEELGLPAPGSPLPLAAPSPGADSAVVAVPSPMRSLSFHGCRVCFAQSAESCPVPVGVVRTCGVVGVVRKGGDPSRGWGGVPSLHSPLLPRHATPPPSRFPYPTASASTGGHCNERV